jgi:hypothetical protein
MKLLARLREPQQTRASQVTIRWLDEAELEQTGDEHDHMGVGAAMVQDLAGMEFLDSYRRRIPEIHEEFPPHGLTYDESAEETES